MRIVEELKEYFLVERDEEIGDLAATLLLDFFCEKVGPTLYNRGVQDSQAFFADKLEELSGLEIW